MELLIGITSRSTFSNMYHVSCLYAYMYLNEVFLLSSKLDTVYRAKTLSIFIFCKSVANKQTQRPYC